MQSEPLLVIESEIRSIPRIFLLFFQLFTWKSFGKSVDTTRNSTLKLVKIANFESVLLKTNEDIAPQNREISQTFVWSVVMVTNINFLLTISIDCQVQHL